MIWVWWWQQEWSAETSPQREILSRTGLILVARDGSEIVGR
jgi:hypothetical protein